MGLQLKFGRFSKNCVCIHDEIAYSVMNVLKIFFFRVGENRRIRIQKFRNRSRSGSRTLAFIIMARKFWKISWLENETLQKVGWYIHVEFHQDFCSGDLILCECNSSLGELFSWEIALLHLLNLFFVKWMFVSVKKELDSNSNAWNVNQLAFLMLWSSYYDMSLPETSFHEFALLILVL